MDTPDKHYDVCVVGSGAGGAPIASALARSGLKVAVIERGRHYHSCDFQIDELAACIRDTFFPDIQEGLREIQYGNAPAITANHLWPGTCVGGGTVRMTGWFLRMKKEDLTPVVSYGNVAGATLADWPLDYETLVRYYNRVQRDVGISGEPGTVPGESSAEPFAFPPLKPHAFAGLIDKACGELGYHSFATPRAVLSTDWSDPKEESVRRSCTLRGFCGSYGCPRGAKASTMVTYIPKAQATGNMSLFPQHYVYKLESTGDRVTRALCFGPDDKRSAVKADMFILACGAIESARLLLNSRDTHCPDGLANSSGQVGKNLTFRFPCKVDGYFATSTFPDDHLVRSTFVQRMTQDFVQLDTPELAYPKGGSIMFILPHPNPINAVKQLSYSQQGTRLYGKALKENMRDYFNFIHLVSEGFIEYLPNPGTSVTLSAKHTDRWGNRAARVSMQAHPENIKASEYIGKQIAIMYRLMGAKRAIYNTVPFLPAGECQHGTCRFGDNKKVSVLRPDCRSHDIANLYVTDGSFMPTGLTVPPTFTIMANSLRVADTILNRAAS